MKKCLSLVLAVLMLLSSVTLFTASAAKDITVISATYNKECTSFEITFSEPVHFGGLKWRYIRRDRPEITDKDYQTPAQTIEYIGADTTEKDGAYYSSVIRLTYPAYTSKFDPEKFGIALCEYESNDTNAGYVSPSYIVGKTGNMLKANYISNVGIEMYFIATEKFVDTTGYYKGGVRLVLDNSRPAPRVTGDVDANGRVDSDDAIYLLYNTFFEDDYPIEQAADFDKNGSRDADDAIYLLYYTFFPDEYPVATTLAEKRDFSPSYPNAAAEYSSMKKNVRTWLMDNINKGTLFSAKMGGTAVGKMTPKVTTGKDSEGNETVTAVYKDTANSMQYTLEGTIYSDNPTIDYVITAKNIGTQNTKKMSDFCALDTSYTLKKSGSYTYHTGVGSLAKANDFEEVSGTLSSTAAKFAPTSGRSSNGAWPFFDFLGNNCGIILAVGWSGQWEAQFTDNGSSVGMKVYQQNFDTILLPNETVRSPRIVLTYFDGDGEYGHNVWRKNVISHYSPSTREDGTCIAPWCLNFWGGTDQNCVADTVDLFFDNGAKFDAVWFDAGWYADYPNMGYGKQSAPSSSTPGTQTWPYRLGWYSVNENLFYKGNLAEIAAKIHSKDTKFLVWWMLEDCHTSVGATDMSFGEDSYYPFVSGYRVLKLADDETLERVIAYYRHKFDCEGVDWIRVDYASAPMNTWKNNDKVDSKALTGSDNNRNGMTENKHIVNFYKLWDTLIEEYPQFYLDNCASGGRRIDIEMMKRSIPLWRTDYETGDDNAMQAETQWLAQWVPLNGGGCVNLNEYHMRSLYSACGSMTWGGINKSNISTAVKNLNELQMTKKYWYGSYYQLLPVDYKDSSVWQAYELYREDLKSGMAVVIRRPNSSVGTTNIKFKGLESSNRYFVTMITQEGYSSQMAMPVSGKLLMNDGLDINIQNQGSSTVVILDAMY